MAYLMKGYSLMCTLRIFVTLHMLTMEGYVGKEKRGITTLYDSHIMDGHY